MPRRTSKTRESGLAENLTAPEIVAEESDRTTPEPTSSLDLNPPGPGHPSVIERLKSRIRRVRRKPADEAVAAPTSAPVEEPETEAPRKGRTRRQAKVAEPSVPDLIPEGESITLAWRQPARATQAVAAPEAPSPAEGLAPRKSRRRRRKDLQEVDITAAAALAEPEPQPEAPETVQRRRRVREKPSPEEPRPEPRPKPQPLAPPKPLIPVPADAPQIAMRSGVPVLVRNGKIIPPIAFFGSSPDEKRARTVLDEVRMAGEGGVHLHSHYVDLEIDPDAVNATVSLAGYLLAKTVEADPEAQVLLRLVFVAPRGWEERFPEARYARPDGSLAEPSVCDDRFWGVARTCLGDFVTKLRELPGQDHILGIHLERGEWFTADDAGYDNSLAAVRMFRRWAEIRYLADVVTLRAAWFDGDADFSRLELPSYQPIPVHGEKFVRSSRKERRWVDYHLFLSDATVNRISDLAYTVKEASQGYYIVGVSYGYTYEWSHPSSGHLSLGKLLRTHEIDFIAGPPSYKCREPGGAAPFPGPIDSFALNGKLYISEEDYKTSIGEGPEPDDFNPPIKTPQALESVHWRGAGAALTHASGLCWMDLWGNGWLKTPGIWSRAEKIRDLLSLRLATAQSEPDVAVFIDERALAYLVDRSAFALLVQNVREAVLRSGLSAGFYLLSDLAHRENFPESKLYVFLNAWDVRSELRAAIKTRLQRDNKVLFWLYAAGLFDSGRDSLERAREVTGIALKPQPFSSKTGTTILNRRHPLCEAFPDKGLLGASHLEPSYFGIPEDATVLGEYSQSGLPSFLIKELHHEGNPELDWKSVFLGEPVVTPALLRALGQLAGCHIWNYQEDLVHVRPPFLLVHCAGAGQRTITLPSKWSAYDVVAGEWAATDTTSLRFNAIDGSSHLFMVGLQSEIEQMLAADRGALLDMPDIPTPADNTLRFDAVGFDVPIVKLDEWMEGGVTDDFAEEFVLPEPMDIPEPEPEEPTRTSRRRRRRPSRGGSEEPLMAPKEFVAESDGEDFGVNVVFRKRE